MARMRAARRVDRSPQAARTRTATTRRSSCRPGGPAGGTHSYPTTSTDTPSSISPTYRIVLRNCPPAQIVLPTADRIRTYRARRNNTADMSVRLRSGSPCRDTLGLFITDDDDDEGMLEARIVSVNKVLERSLAHVIECIGEQLMRINDELNTRFVIFTMKC